MNILFLSLVRKDSIEEPGIYTDLLRQFRNNGHSVYIVSPYEKRLARETTCYEKNGAHMLYVRIGNITKCGKIEKGISTLKVEKQYLSAIKKYFSEVHFDLVLYSTPPITLVGVVEYIKKRDNAKTYLLLKDIFPQNAVDIGMMQTSGLKGLLYKFFRTKEKKLYAISDYIGCMSPANVEYVLKHNPEIGRDKVGVCPNSIEPKDMSVSEEERISIREKYGIPQDKKVFIYGGNLGKPQGIPFLIDCLRSQKDNDKAFFLIVGDGTDYSKLDNFIKKESPSNVKLMNRLPKEDYDRMVAACDVGMIFLDHRFTIPNFPSRLLAYMQAKIPVLACTDPNTDVGKIITEGDFGWWCESDSVHSFDSLVSKIIKEDISLKGNRGYDYLYQNYNVKTIYYDINSAANLYK